MAPLNHKGFLAPAPTFCYLVAPMTTIIDRGHGVQLHIGEGAPTRRCGDCQLCCKLIPVKNLGKPAGQRCRYQRVGKGCTVHHKLATVSPSCALWSCRWLVENDTADLRRPDRSHYVIDVMPDFVTLRNNETGAAEHVEAVQIWVDPRYPDAHRDPALRAYLERRAEKNVVGLVRWSNTEGMVIFPPALSQDRQWHEARSALNVKEHSIDEVVAALSSA
jgi:hypothetical protein